MIYLHDFPRIFFSFHNGRVLKEVHHRCPPLVYKQIDRERGRYVVSNLTQEPPEVIDICRNPRVNHDLGSRGGTRSTSSYGALAYNVYLLQNSLTTTWTLVLNTSSKNCVKAFVPG